MTSKQAAGPLGTKPEIETVKQWECPLCPNSFDTITKRVQHEDEIHGGHFKLVRQSSGSFDERADARVEWIKKGRGSGRLKRGKIRKDDYYCKSHRDYHPRGVICE
jgi:hypothetical protein